MNALDIIEKFINTHLNAVAVLVCLITPVFTFFKWWFAKIRNKITNNKILFFACGINSVLCFVLLCFSFNAATTIVSIISVATTVVFLVLYIANKQLETIKSLVNHQGRIIGIIEDLKNVKK